MPRIDYGKYLASREWAIRKRAVHERSFGWCERCHQRPASQVHHSSYAHIGAEPLEDLLDVCELCHQYLSAIIDVDPVLYPTLDEAQEWESLLEDDVDPELVSRVQAWAADIRSRWLT